MNIIDYLTKIHDSIEKLKQAQDSQEDRLLIAFRGESKDYEVTKLMPSIFRNPEYIKKEKYLYELFHDYYMYKNSVSNIEKAIDTQHYAQISRMLDISFNSMIALYFACDDSNGEESDGVLYIFAFPEYYSPHSKYIEEFYENILNSKTNITYSKNFKVFSHTYANDRIKAQSGGFIFFSGNEFNPIDDCYYEKVMIRYEDKKKIRDSLKEMFHISEAKLFPEKANIAAEIKKQFTENKYMEMIFCVENEIDTALARISYELKLSKNRTKRDVLRKIRKEENDLLTYLSIQAKEFPNSIESKNREMILKEKISSTFKAYRIFCKKGV